MFEHRLLSVRGYDQSAMLVDAEVMKGVELKGAIQQMFDKEDVSYLHIHNAGQGCFLCRAVRA